METMEGQNQPKIASRFQEILEEGKEDRISALPDGLIIEILSRLPYTKEAIRTGTLSKRWKHLWAFVSCLVFIEPSYWYADKTKSRPNLVPFVENALTQLPQLKRKKFFVITVCDNQFESQANNWIRYAISCNIEELNLMLLDTGAELEADQVLYVSSYLIELRLAGWKLNPIGAISWKNLRCLCIWDVKLDEDMIENILSGSPVLETLVLGNCYGYRQLNITSKSVKHLGFGGYNSNFEEEHFVDIIEINAPYISSLTIQNQLVLWKLVLLNLSSLVEALLYYYKLGCYETTIEEDDEETLKGFIQKLSHVKVLKIGNPSSQVVSRLKAKGFVFPPNVKFSDY